MTPCEAGFEKQGGWKMNRGTFGRVVLLIVMFAFVTTYVKCIHDTYCTKCKKQ